MLKGKAWDQQINAPKRQLEKITGVPIESFAYPYGAWNETVISELKNQGIKIAFQLSGKQSEKEPLFTVRRLMVSGRWSGADLQKQIENNFK